jgi:hypothetical protein
LQIKISANPPLMKTAKQLIFCFIFSASAIMQAQERSGFNITKDAMVRAYDGFSDGLNYGGYEYINMHGATNGGVWTIQRSLIEFNLSSIPQFANITNATLFLYSDENSESYPNGHEPRSGSNECEIYRITSPWDEYLVTWTNQPSYSSNNAVYVPASSASFQDYQINVTVLVQDMINSPSSSHGFFIKLMDENYYRRLVFASGDHNNSGLHPKLQVSYDNANGIENNPVSSGFNCFPNPTNGSKTINIVKNYADEMTLKVMSLTGELVIETQNSNLDVSELSKGLYFLQMEQNNQVIGVKRLIVN